MPFGQINNIGQGEIGPGRGRSYQAGQSSRFAASSAIGSNSSFQPLNSQFSINPLFYGPKADSLGHARNYALSNISSNLQSIFNYHGPYSNGISDNRIEGLHPGGGIALSVIRGMTPFGSKIDLSKALDFGLYNSPAVIAHRKKVQEYLAILGDPNANLISFDLETSGVKSELEEYRVKGQAFARPTEFSIRSTSGYHSKGFTKYGDKRLLKALSKDSDFGKEFGEAALRREAYTGPKYSAVDIVTKIVESIDPTKKNVLLGHNIGSFDLKVLSAQYAIEKGYVTKEQIREFQNAGVSRGSKRRKAVQSKRQEAVQKEISKGWNIAQDEIMSLFRSKDKDIRILDTLGSSSVGTFNRMIPAGGLLHSIMEGYLPGVQKAWLAAGNTAGLSAKEAYEQSIFSARKGTSLSSFMEFIGRPFVGKAHDADFDTLETLNAFTSDEFRSFINRADENIRTKNVQGIHSDTIKFIHAQQSEQAEVVRRGVGTEGRLKLAKMMAETEFDETVPKAAFQRIKTSIFEGFKKAPLESKVAVGLVGALVAGNVIAGLFRGNRKISTNSDDYRQFDGMHPGNGGYATSIIQGTTGFGSEANLKKIIDIGERICAGRTVRVEGLARAANIVGGFESPKTLQKDKGDFSLLENLLPGGFQHLRKAIKGTMKGGKSEDWEAVKGTWLYTSGLRYALDKGGVGLSLGVRSIDANYVKSATRKELKGTLLHERQHQSNYLAGFKDSEEAQDILRRAKPETKDTFIQKGYQVQFKIQGDVSFADELTAWTHNLKEDGAKVLFAKESSSNVQYYNTVAKVFRDRAKSIKKGIRENYEPPMDAMWEPANIEGLHPGNKGYSTSIIQSTTDFGSGIIKEKVLQRASRVFGSVGKNLGSLPGVIDRSMALGRRIGEDLLFGTWNTAKHITEWGYHGAVNKNLSTPKRIASATLGLGAPIALMDSAMAIGNLAANPSLEMVGSLALSATVFGTAKLGVMGWVEWQRTKPALKTGLSLIKEKMTREYAKTYSSHLLRFSKNQLTSFIFKNEKNIAFDYAFFQKSSTNQIAREGARYYISNNRAVNRSVSSLVKKNLRISDDFISTVRENYGLNIAKETYTRIEGLHPGAGPLSMGKREIHNKTDFGSGWRGLIKIPKILHEQLASGHRFSGMVYEGEDNWAPIRNLVSSLRGSKKWKDGKSWRFRKAFNKFAKDAKEAESSGLKSYQVAFINPTLIKKSKLDLRTVIRHERQHIYSYTSKDTLPKKLNSRLGSRRRKFLQNFYVPAGTEGEEYLAQMAGLGNLRGKRLARQIKEHSWLTEDIQEDVKRYSQTIESTRNRAMASFVDQQVFYPGVSTYLKEHPTCGLGSVLEKCGRGSTRYQTRARIR